MDIMAVMARGLAEEVEDVQVHGSTTANSDGTLRPPTGSTARYGVKWADLKITGAQLLGSCYQGYTLYDCKNQNSTSDRPGVSNRFLPAVPYCLNCCGNPTATGTDETWDLQCPLTPLQRSVVINDIGKRFVFARRQTITDETLITCEWPRRNISLYLAGYTLELDVTQYSSDGGWKFWVGVNKCTVVALETNSTPIDFIERIRMVSVRQSYTASANWYILLVGFMIVLVFASWVIYRGYYRKEQCVNCASKWVVVNSLCGMCILCGCRLHAPPPRVFCAESYEATVNK